MKDDSNRNEPEVDIEPTGEDNVMDEQLQDIEASGQSKIKQLQAKLKECEREKREHLDDLQRAKADFLNAKKRLEDERINDRQRAINEHVIKLLPLYDSFAMAMNDKEAWNAVDEVWRTGVESIQSQLTKILQSYNVTVLNPLGEQFDPNVHEAMSEVPVSDKAADNTIVSVIQNGFARTNEGHEVIIRPARVAVGVYNE